MAKKKAAKKVARKDDLPMKFERTTEEERKERFLARQKAKEKLAEEIAKGNAVPRCFKPQSVFSLVEQARVAERIHIPEKKKGK